MLLSVGGHFSLPIKSKLDCGPRRRLGLVLLPPPGLLRTPTGVRGAGKGEVGRERMSQRLSGEQSWDTSSAEKKEDSGDGGRC